ncbi:EamA family transporter RarD [Campylobacter geochelonis]|uniref:EamA family transporter RarD n=1 Tax=Campylobacter geochelonis TaxID=1780362 RepID=UPI00077088B7|nr:EamA family transporter RarD [Campylobacter geochelonis]CZE50285.1 RarD protein [Campylobacter geochelonis]
MKIKPNAKIGLFYGVASFTMWGLFPVYFKLLSNVGATEGLAHRLFWSVIFLYFFIVFTHKTKSLTRILHKRKLVKKLLISGVFITLNWGIYIYAVFSSQILEASLGQLINPLFFMFLGAIFLKERLNLAAKISIFIVFVAIAIQIYALGKIPFISIFLPASFAIYGLLKKRLQIPPMEGLFIETMMFLPLTLGYVIYLEFSGVGSFTHGYTWLLLILSGLVTIVPMITFNIAAKHLSLSTLGFLQYTTPTIGVFLAVLAYGEHLNNAKIASFILIWISIAIVSFDSYHRHKKHKPNA